VKGAVGMGAPIFDHSGRVIGGLCITIPEVRYSALLEKPLSDLLKAQAHKLSTALGFTGGYPGI
jgi:DNA-binding IclR family transcriptional regulator